MKLSLTGTDWQKQIVNEVINSNIRFYCICAGRRAGKSFCFRTSATVFALKNPGVKIWYICPTYSQVKEQFEEMITNPAMHRFITATKSQPYPSIRFMNGSTIGFRTFERPKNLKGSGLDLVWVDEIQDIDGDQFWPVVRPLISDKRGKLVISGQHNGKNSWYYKELFIRGLKDNKEYDPIYKSYQIHSKHGLCFQSDEGKEELEIVKKQMPDLAFRIQYACEAISSEAAVFRYDDLEYSKIEPINPQTGKVIQIIESPLPNERYIAAIDLGRVTDPSSVVVLNKNNVIYTETFPLKLKHEMGAKKIADICKRYNGAQLIIDSTGGGKPGKNDDEFVKMYKKTVPSLREFFWTQKSKVNIIEALCLALEQKKIHIPKRHKNLHAELSLYEYKLKSGGRIEYGAPKGEHDDAVAALAMAWYSRKFITNPKNFRGLTNDM